MKKLTVTEITQQIKFLIENNFNTPVIVVGEISNFSTSPSGHSYFTLKDEKAQIKVVFFKRYKMASKYKPQQGDKVEVVGDLTVYEADGVYQIIARKINYDSTGDFYKKFEETKRILEQEGLFDKDKKKDIPKIVKKLAVITSPTGAAIKDFIQTLKINNIGLEIDIWPVQVQGSQAIGNIIQTIDKLEKFKHKYDVAILMRGGGSLEDLIIFNDETLARKFFSLGIPTISAIGHERDFSICDFVADLRVSTPTAAAETLSKPYIENRNVLENKITIMISNMENLLYKNFQILDKYISLLNYQNPINLLNNKRDIVDRHVSNILSSIKLQINKNLLMLNKYFNIVNLNSPVMQINQVSSKLDYLTKNMSNLFNNKIKEVTLKLNSTIGKLKVLNPTNILERGYAIVYNRESKPVSSVKSINLEDCLEIQFKDGYSSVFVTGKKTKRD